MAFNGLEKGCFSKAKAWEQSNQRSPGTCMKQSLSIWIKTQGTCSRNKIGNWSRGRWFLKLQVGRISWLCFLFLSLLWGNKHISPHELYTSHCRKCSTFWNTEPPQGRVMYIWLLRNMCVNHTHIPPNEILLTSKYMNWLFKGLKDWRIDCVLDILFCQDFKFE